MKNTAKSMILAAGMLLLSSDAFAQAETTRRPQVVPGPISFQQPRPQNLHEGPTVSISFPGGAVEDLIKALREAAKDGPAVNITVANEVRAVRVPAIQLKDVSLLTALEAMKAVAEQPTPNSALAIAPMYTDGASPAFALVLNQVGYAPVNASRQELRVMSIRDLTSAQGKAKPGVAIDTLLTAVQTALELNAEDGTTLPPAQVKFHEESSLLIVRGERSQIDAVQQVVMELTKSTEIARKNDLQFAAAQGQVARANGEVKMAKLRLDAAKALVKVHEDTQLRVPEETKLEAKTQAEAAAIGLEMAEFQKTQVERQAEIGLFNSGKSDDVVEKIGEMEKMIGQLRSRIDELTAKKK